MGVAALRAASAAVRRLALFSHNERVDDVATAELKYLLVPFMLAEVRLRRRRRAASVSASPSWRASSLSAQLIVRLDADERVPLVSGESEA